MLGYLNAGFGEVLGNTWLDRIHALGYAGIRTDILVNWRPIIDELGIYNKLSPIFLFGGGDLSDWPPERFENSTRAVARYITDSGFFPNLPVFFEIGNEADIAVPDWRNHPEILGKTFWECYQVVKSINPRIELITGGIANLNHNGFDYLERFLDSGIPAKAIVGFHRYPNGKDIKTPHDGFRTRENEFNRLRALAGDRRLFCTETGLSEGPFRERRGFPLCWLNKRVVISELVQSQAIEHEWNFWRRRGIMGMVWYQLRDGSDPRNKLDHYGIYTINEEEKASCDVIRKLSMNQ